MRINCGILEWKANCVPAQDRELIKPLCCAEFFLILYINSIKGCMDVGRILHTFLHLLGMFHMHTAIDRDEYVRYLIN
jgi:hypothetical protein